MTFFHGACPLLRCLCSRLWVPSIPFLLCRPALDSAVFSMKPCPRFRCLCSRLWVPSILFLLAAMPWILQSSSRCLALDLQGMSVTCRALGFSMYLGIFVKRPTPPLATIEVISLVGSLPLLHLLPFQPVSTLSFLVHAPVSLPM